MVLQGHHHANPPRGLDDHRVHDERRVRDHRLLARAQEGPHDELDELVRAVAHDELVGGEAVAAGEGDPEVVGAAVRIPVEVRQGVGDGLEDALRGRQGVLVGGELDDIREAELALELLDGLARLVGRDAEDVIVGDGFPGHGHERLLRRPGRIRGS